MFCERVLTSFLSINYAAPNKDIAVGRSMIKLYIINNMLFEAICLL